jgi:sporulation protein YlmC with PRC-barrel domain
MRTFGLAAALVAAWTLTATAQNVEAGKQGVKTESTAPAKFVSHRTSKVVGMTVKNKAGEDLGKIEDLVMDEGGHIHYAAVSYGGFLGFNNKLFAVPFKAFAIKHDAGSSTYHMELNVSKKYLENADGFPSDKWPDFNDAEMRAKWDKFYLRDGDKATSTTTPAAKP